MGNTYLPQIKSRKIVYFLGQIYRVFIMQSFKTLLSSKVTKLHKQNNILQNILQSMGSKAKWVSNWKQNMLYTKSWQSLYRKRISIITGLERNVNFVNF